MTELVLKKHFKIKEVAHSSLLFICHYSLISKEASQNLLGGLQTYTHKTTLSVILNFKSALNVKQYFSSDFN